MKTKLVIAFLVLPLMAFAGIYSPGFGGSGGGGSGGGSGVTTNQLFVYTQSNSVAGRPLVRGTSTNDFTSSDVIYATTNVAPLHIGLTTITTNATATCPPSRNMVEFDYSIPTSATVTGTVIVWYTNSLFFGSNVMQGAIGAVSTAGATAHYTTILDPNATFKVQTIAGSTLALPVISNFRNTVL